jgi:hypothetical protein
MWILACAFPGRGVRGADYCSTALNRSELVTVEGLSSSLCLDYILSLGPAMVAVASF